MSRYVPQIATLVIVLGGAAILGLLFLFRQGPATAAPEVLPPLVSTVELGDPGASFEINVDGVVVPKRLITLAAEVAGRVEWRSPEFRAGNYVTSGTPLLRIDSRLYQLEVTRLEKEIQQFSVDVEQLSVERENVAALVELAEKELQLAQREYNRLEPLARRNAVTQSDVDTAERSVVQTRNALRTLNNTLALIPKRESRLQATLELTRAKLDQAKLDLEKTEVEAPISGVISQEGVQDNDFVQRGTMLLTLQDTSVMEVKCNLRLDDLYWLWSSSGRQPQPDQSVADTLYEVPHALANVTYQVGGGSYTWDGFLSRYEGVGVDEATRTVPCRVEVPSPTREEPGDGPPTLVRGMFVTVTLDVQPRVKLLSIPSRALRPGDELWSIESWDEASPSDPQRAKLADTWRTLRVHNIRVAKVLRDSVLIRAASTRLEPGERIVISPLPVAVDGMRVRVPQDETLMNDDPLMNSGQESPLE